MTDETIEAIAKAIYQADGAIGDYPWNIADAEKFPEDWANRRALCECRARAAYAVARDAVLAEVNAELAKHAVEIEGTPYSCGPHKWMKFVHAMKWPKDE